MSIFKRAVNAVLRQMDYKEPSPVDFSSRSRNKGQKKATRPKASGAASFKRAAKKRRNIKGNK